MVRRSVVAVAVLSLATLTWAQEQIDFVGPEIGSFSAGVVCSPLSNGSMPAPGTISGSINLIDGDVRFSTPSRRVPAVLGLSFGVMVSAKLRDIDPIIMRISHPPMGEGGVEVETYQTWMSASALKPSLFSFEHDYELVLGTWTIEALENGVPLYQATFEVVPPTQIPELAGLCGFEDLIG